MKRLIAITVCLLMLVAGSVTALADDAIQLSIQGDTTCAPGSTITLSFQVEKGSNMCAADFRVGFDTDDFKFLEYTASSLLSQHQGPYNENYGGQFALAVAGLNPITKGGELFTIQFQVDSAASGNHDFYFFSTSFCDYDTNAIATETAKFTINVTGTPVSSETVDPVLDESGKAVEAVDTPTAITEGVPQTSNNSSSSGKNTAIVVILVVALAGVIVLVVVGIIRSKKEDKPEEPEYQSVLDEDAKELLDSDFATDSKDTNQEDSDE